MKAFIAFTKKELLEQIRSGRLLITGALFLALGIMNPAVAKLTPWLLKLFADSLAGSGITVTEATVSAIDSWAQFFKNIEDYSEGQKTAAYMVLGEIVNLLNEFADNIRIIGGWVPTLLYPESDHIGSIDVDLLLNQQAPMDAFCLANNRNGQHGASLLQHHL